MLHVCYWTTHKRPVAGKWGVKCPGGCEGGVGTVGERLEEAGGRPDVLELAGDRDALHPEPERKRAGEGQAMEQAMRSSGWG